MHVLKIEHFHKQSTRGEYVLRNGEVTPNVFLFAFSSPSCRKKIPLNFMAMLCDLG